MQIRSAQFVISATDLDGCPDPDVPEFAFIGRSNVGKSSLINALLGGRHLEDGVTPTTDRVYLIKQAVDGGGAATTAPGALITQRFSNASLSRFSREPATTKPPACDVILPVASRKNVFSGTAPVSVSTRLSDPAAAS